MKLIKNCLPSLIIFISLITAQNNYPIVLVHGFLGWGPDEMIGYKYWGGFWDLEEYLEKEGFTVITVSIGPVSSNWERAVEIYYQLKGGHVDYGKSHSDKFGVIQKPVHKTYVGLYPDWDAEHPVHFIGHSMGGQTIRMLDYLLENSIFADSLETQYEESELLGETHSGIIKSITTISAPHNGTTYFDVRMKTIPFFQNFIGLAAVIGSDFYDFDLQHWDLEQKEGESWQDYYNRMDNHAAWGSKNISNWDLSLDGAQELNTYVKANPNVYYFSFGTSASIRDQKTGFYVPGDKVFVSLISNIKKIGREITYFADGTPTDSTWFENDGVVNTNSMWGPTTGLNGPDKIVKYSADEKLVPGQWYTFSPLEMDHYYAIGQAIISKKKRNKLYKIYSDHCQLLYSLPQ
ncbi:MAG: lipase [Candidatus Neomarinimicrobiota bacterium]